MSQKLALAVLVKVARVRSRYPEKRAVLDALLGGGLIGSGIGAAKAPSGHKWEGAGRGAAIGAMTGPPVGLGALLGGAGGIALGHGAGALSKGMGMPMGQQNIGRLAGALGLLGLGGGAYAGGKLGLHIGRKVVGPPTWEGKPEAGASAKPKTPAKTSPEGQGEPLAKAAFDRLSEVLHAVGRVKAARDAALGQMLKSLDRLAQALPVTKQASVRVVQQELAQGHDLTRAIKVAFPVLPPEARGILAVKFARFASKNAERRVMTVPARDAGKAMHECTA